MQTKHLLQYTMSEQYSHGRKVGSLAYMVAEQMGLPEEKCRMLAAAGMVHDIGKLSLQAEMNADSAMIVEEMGYLRQHPQRGYEMLKHHGMQEEICEIVLYHHENWDGSGYPYNLEGKNIPLGACIIRVCDVFCALTDDRPYRKAYTPEKALSTMISEIKYYNVRVFLALQQLLHCGENGEVRIPECPIDVRGELRKVWH